MCEAALVLQKACQVLIFTWLSFHQHIHLNIIYPYLHSSFSFMATEKEWSARQPQYFRKPVVYLFFTQLSPPHRHQTFPRGVFSLISGRLIFHFPRFTVCQRCGASVEPRPPFLSLQPTSFVMVKLFNVLLITY